MCIDDTGDFSRRCARDVVADGRQLFACRFHGCLKALNFVFQQVLWQHVLWNFRVFAVQHIGLANGDSTADTGAVQGQHAFRFRMQKRNEADSDSGQQV